MTTTLLVPLKRGVSDETVSAELTDGLTLQIAQRADRTWADFLAGFKAEAAARGEKTEEPEHTSWEWEKKFNVTARFLPFTFYRIECEGDIQGLMLIQSDGYFYRASLQHASPLVYVMFLAVAPWNYGRLVKTPRFRGGGPILLRSAIELSLDLGFKGRIGLHALPQSESWYEKYDITRFARDQGKGGLRYYEMTSTQAQNFLR